MKTLYLDLIGGISGDMFLGALLDLGVDFATVERELGKLGVGGYHLHSQRGHKAQIHGTKFEVHLEGGVPAEHTHSHESGEAVGHSHGHGHHVHDALHVPINEPHPLTPSLSPSEGERAAKPGEGGHAGFEDSMHAAFLGASAFDKASGRVVCSEASHVEHRTFAAIRAMIEGSALSPWVRQKAVAVFGRIAVAEGRVHGVPPDEVHFHEVGAIDSIVDIVGGCVALEQLGCPRVLSGPVLEGTGFLQCAHGRYPLPGPATLAILGARGIPVTQCAEPAERVTPTGAALLAEFAESFGPLQGFVAERIGYGLGTRDLRDAPNVLRAMLGECGMPGGGHDWETDTVAVLETNLDDVSAEVLGHVLARALELGARDVFHTAVQMKKNRPGVLLTVLCDSGDADRFTEFLLRETTAFGVRRSLAERRKLRREMRSVSTEWGEVAVKLGWLDGRAVQVAPEYESCRAVAERAGVPLRQVLESTRRAASGLAGTEPPAAVGGGGHD